MRTFDVTRHLDADPDRVWDALVDTRRWPDWGPTVRGATVDGGGPRIGPGARGRVRTAAGVALPYRVVAWEEGRRWAWAVAGVAATGHRVEPDPAGGCRAVIEVPWWAPAYAAVCWVALGRLGAVA